MGTARSTSSTARNPVLCRLSPPLRTPSLSNQCLDVRLPGPEYSHHPTPQTKTSIVPPSAPTHISHSPQNDLLRQYYLLPPSECPTRAARLQKLIETGPRPSADPRIHFAEGSFCILAYYRYSYHPRVAIDFHHRHHIPTPSAPPHSCSAPAPPTPAKLQRQSLRGLSWCMAGRRFPRQASSLAHHSLAPP